MHNQDGKFIVKALILFGSISLVFSSIGLLFPESPHTFVIGSPLEVSTISLEHVIGHILWGAVIGGGFAILLDADHLLQFLDLEMIVRMSHAIPFAIIAAFVFYFVFNRRDLRLGAVAFSAVLSHIAFDIFLVDVLYPGSVGEFPLFAPLLFDKISFQGTDWLIFEIVGFVIVMICSIFSVKKKISKNASVTKT